MRRAKSFSRSALLAVVLGMLFAGAPITPAHAIIDGTLVPQTELQSKFPWMVRLNGGCGGALYTPWLVLTAAHCVNGLTNEDGGTSELPFPTGQVTTVFNITITQGAVDLQGSAATVRTSDAMFVAPGWTGDTRSSPDWALVRLSSPIQGVPVLKLAVDTSLHNGALTVLGWGATSYGSSQQQYLRKAVVDFVDDSPCGANNGKTNLYPDWQLCAGDFNAGGPGACKGDSGGPLVKQNGLGEWVSVGIVSWGDDNCDGTSPDVYTEVRTFARDICDAAAMMGGCQTALLHTAGSPIAAAHDADGTIGVVGTNPVEVPYWRKQNTVNTNFSWSAWNKFDGLVRSVAAETDRDGRVTMFGVTSSGQVFTRRETSANSDYWSSWSLFGGTVTSLTVARNADDRLEVFGVSAMDSVWHRWELTPGGAWSDWTLLGDNWRTVAAERDGLGRIALFGLDQNGYIHYRRQTDPNSTSWTAPQAMDGLLTSIAVARNADGRLEIFGTNSADTPWHRWEIAAGGPWSGWSQFDGALRHVAAETNADGRIELFGVNTYGMVWHRWQLGAGSASWSSWAELGGTLRPANNVVLVPPIVGMTVAQATPEIEMAGLVVGTKTGKTVWDSSDSGKILSTYPTAAGSPTSVGSVVNMYVGIWGGANR